MPVPVVRNCHVVCIPSSSRRKKMRSREPNRREFTKFTAAAVGGVLAGLSAGRLGAATDKGSGSTKKDPDKPLLLQDPHICRGLNASCKGEVKGKKNDCAGMASGPTSKEHACKGQNDCAGEGGCGEHPGENKCKGMGDCAVPLKDTAWAKARANFEAAMTKAGKKFGDAPKADSK
jgi:hypothetical protein